MEGNTTFGNESLSSLISMQRHLLSEIRRLTTENIELKKRLAVYEGSQERRHEINETPRFVSLIPEEITPEMAGFFFSVFRGRSDVYSRRVKRKDGRAAYYPVCMNFASNFYKLLTKDLIVYSFLI